MKAAEAQKNKTPAEILALTNYRRFVKLLSEKKQELAKISPDSVGYQELEKERQRLGRIAAYCHKAQPTNPELRCKACNAIATHAELIIHNDGSVVIPHFFCTTHLPDSSTGIMTIPILISMTYRWKGAARKELQKVVRKAFQLPSRVSATFARDFFANCNRPSPKPGWWLRYE